MPQPTLGDVHVNRPLTTLSVGYKQDDADFVANKAFPEIPVNQKSDSYYVYNRGDFFRDSMRLRAPGTPAEAGGYKLGTATYNAQVWALKKIVDDQIRANSDSPLQPDRDAVLWLTQQALLNRDINWALAYFTTTVWATDITGVTGAPNAGEVKRWNLAGSTPLDDILAGTLALKRTTGLWANTLVLGAEVFMTLLTNAQIIDRLKYGSKAGAGPVVVELGDLQSLFKLKRILVMSGIKTTSAEVAEADSDVAGDTFAFIGGKSALLCYAADSPGLFQPSAGYTFNWTGLTGSTAGGMRIKKFRWEIDAADHIEIEQAYDQKLVSKALGYFFTTLVS